MLHLRHQPPLDFAPQTSCGQRTQKAPYHYPQLTLRVGIVWWKEEAPLAVDVRIRPPASINQICWPLEENRIWEVSAPPVAFRPVVFAFGCDTTGRGRRVCALSCLSALWMCCEALLWLLCSPHRVYCWGPRQIFAVAFMWCESQTQTTAGFERAPQN